MDKQAEQQPPPYSAGAGISAPYPTKAGGPPTQAGPAPMQPEYPAKPGYVAANPGYVAANPGYPPRSTPTVTTTTTVVQQQPPIIFNSGFMYGELPVNMQCPICHTQIVTAIEFAPGTLSWLACCGLAAVGCIFGCCFIPFCIDEMKDVTHICPNCKHIQGIYHRL